MINTTLVFNYCKNRFIYLNLRLYINKIASTF